MDLRKLTRGRKTNTLRRNSVSTASTGSAESAELQQQQQHHHHEPGESGVPHHETRQRGISRLFGLKSKSKDRAKPSASAIDEDVAVKSIPEESAAAGDQTSVAHVLARAATGPYATAAAIDEGVVTKGGPEESAVGAAGDQTSVPHVLARAATGPYATAAAVDEDVAVKSIPEESAAAADRALPRPVLGRAVTGPYASGGFASGPSFLQRSDMTPKDVVEASAAAERPPKPKKQSTLKKTRRLFGKAGRTRQPSPPHDPPPPESVANRKTIWHKSTPSWSRNSNSAGGGGGGGEGDSSSSGGRGSKSVDGGGESAAKQARSSLSSTDGSGGLSNGSGAVSSAKHDRAVSSESSSTPASNYSSTSNSKAARPKPFAHFNKRSHTLSNDIPPFSGTSVGATSSRSFRRSRHSDPNRQSFSMSRSRPERHKPMGRPRSSSSSVLTQSPRACECQSSDEEGKQAVRSQAAGKPRSLSDHSVMITTSNSLQGDLPLIGNATVVTLPELSGLRDEAKESFGDGSLLPVSSGGELMADGGKLYAMPRKRNSFAPSDDEKEADANAVAGGGRRRADTDASVDVIDSLQVFAAYANRKVVRRKPKKKDDPTDSFTSEALLAFENFYLEGKKALADRTRANRARRGSHRRPRAEMPAAIDFTAILFAWFAFFFALALNHIARVGGFWALVLGGMAAFLLAYVDERTAVDCR